MTADQLQSETPRRKEFQDSLRLLTGITSRQLWSSALMMALLAGAIVLLLFPLQFAPAGLFHTFDPSLPVLGLLVLVCVVSGVTLRQQWRTLKLLREGLIEQINSVIKQRAKAEKFYGLATQDALTGLYNRRFGETRLQEEIARAEKSGEPLMLLAVDFDRFKVINDQFGHAAGDLALKEFSRRLQRAVRACDVAIRVGGDEFLVIFPECTLDRIPEIMSRMDSIAFTFAGEKIGVSFSYGTAQYQPDDTPETMLRRADERLYAQKARRKAGGTGSTSPWDDAEMAIDGSFPPEWDPGWVPQGERQGQQASSPVGAPGLLQNKADTIIKEALHNLQDPSENDMVPIRPTRRLPYKWLVSALAFSVALITLWAAMPRKSSQAATFAGAKDHSGSGLPTEEAAGMSSAKPTKATPFGLQQGSEAGHAIAAKPLESTVFGTHPCAAADAAAPGFSTEMAQVMPRVPGFRLATKEDFDPEAVSWLKNEGQEASGEVPGDLTGSGEYRAYLWVGKDKSWHVVLLANAQTRCDVSFPSVAIAAPVSKESIKRIQWEGPAPPESSGDGLLIVRSAKDPASGVFLSLRGNEIVGSRPADYRQVPLGERK